jgi:GNAT superfamily N-acetyltransferase
MAVALGSDHERPSAGLRDLDLQRLGKNIDTLVKARVAIDELRKRVLDPAAGYQIHHEMVPEIAGSGPLLRVRATSPSGETVGHGLFTHQGQNLVPGTIGVHEDHQRRGLASAMYAHAEKVTGKKLVPSTMQTDEGQALWAGNQTKPQFGKGEKKPQGGAEAPGPAHAATPPLAAHGAPGPLRPRRPARARPSACTPSRRSSRPRRPALIRCRPASERCPEGPQEQGPDPEGHQGSGPGPCPVCDGRQFKADQFQGCICFRELAKSSR